MIQGLGQSFVDKEQLEIGVDRGFLECVLQNAFSSLDESQI